METRSSQGISLLPDGAPLRCSEAIEYWKTSDCIKHVCGDFASSAFEVLATAYAQCGNGWAGAKVVEARIHLHEKGEHTASIVVQTKVGRVEVDMVRIVGSKVARWAERIEFAEGGGI